MYHHISSEERDLIAAWHHQGSSARSIARGLRRSHASIIRELRRNRSRISGQYVSIAAQEQATMRAVDARRRHPLKHPLVYAYVHEQLRARWSPEQIAGRLKKDHGHPVICPETIYQFVYEEDNPRSSSGSISREARSGGGRSMGEVFREHGSHREFPFTRDPKPSITAWSSATGRETPWRERNPRETGSTRRWNDRQGSSWRGRLTRSRVQKPSACN